MEQMSFASSLVTEPFVEPISLKEAKEHLRVDFTDDDNYIASLVCATRQYVEEISNRALITQTWDIYFDRFPSRTIILPKNPVQSITSVKYVDDNGNEQTWAASNYRVDTNSEPARIEPVQDEVFPTTDEVTNAVTIRIVSGYGDPNDVPVPIKQAMLLLIGHMYEHRESVVMGSASRVPMATEYLLSPYRVLLF